jgi:acetyltransferase-like isoleucine patch superfamily enzyme
LKIAELAERIRFWRAADRIGPDIPYTHWRLHFRSTMQALCERKFCHFGEGAEFRPGAYAVYCSKISLGRRVVIRPGTMLFADTFEGITIEDDVLLGAGVHMYVNDHRFEDPRVPIIDQGDSPSAPVLVRKGAWIGANAVILAGVTIGENSVVGAGSVVTRSVPACVVAAGSPARIVRRLGADAGEKAGEQRVGAA